MRCYKCGDKAQPLMSVCKPCEARVLIDYQKQVKADKAKAYDSLKYWDNWIKAND